MRKSPPAIPPAPPPRRRRIEPAANRLAALLGGVVAARGFAATEMITHWAQIVGARLGAVSAPAKLRHQRGKSGGVLEIVVDGPLALEFQHCEPQIVEALNAYCGFRAVERLKLVRGRLPRQAPPRPVPPPLSEAAKAAIDRAVATIGDDNLRRALAGLGAEIWRRGPV